MGAGYSSDAGISREEAYELMDSSISRAVLEKRVGRIMLQRGPKVVTYSRNIFIPLTTLCRNRCGYCGFAGDPAQMEKNVLSPEEVRELLKKGVAHGCSEALFVLGERPEEAAPGLRGLLGRWGFPDMVEYLCRMCEQALELGLLPHTNAGILSSGELDRLRRVNASMGLMLESVSPDLCGPGGAHQFSPGKGPAARLRHIDEAGRQGIAFTTGILVGIGERPRERVEAMLAIRDLHRRHGHIQEIIIQNFCPKKETPMENFSGPSLEEMLKTVSIARLIFGPAMNIQAPPNLNPKVYPLYIRAGANDWGGVSPVTEDMLNPEKPWPAIEEIRRETEKAGFVLRERLPVYPEFISDKYLAPKIYDKVMDMAGPQGYKKEG